MDGSQPFGPHSAQVGERNHGPGLRCVLGFLCGLERAVFRFIGLKSRKNFEVLSFSVFSFSGKTE
jgi:hypothetical protein